MQSSSNKHLDSVWYISKYLSEPTATDPGSRGYHLMDELVRRGLKVTVLSSDAGHHFFGSEGLGRRRYSETVRLSGLRLIRIRTLKYWKQRSIRRILSWLDFELRLLVMPKDRLPRPDVIIASSLSLLTVVSGLLLSFRYRCKFIFEVRDIWPLTLVEEGGFSRYNPLIFVLSLIEWLGYRCSHAVVGTMPNLGEHVRARVRRAPPVHCIPIGLDPGSITTEDECTSVRSPTFASPGQLLVGYSGSMGVSNALDTLLLCAEELVHDRRFHFVFLGQGDLEGKYRLRFGHLPNISFLQPVPRKDVARFLGACDILWFATRPSLVWKYGQSLNKLVDYMMAGKPVIGCLSGHPSMIDEAQCGAFVPAGDVAGLRAEVVRLAELNGDARRELGLRGQRWILAHRSYRVLALRYQALLQGCRGAVAARRAEDAVESDRGAP